MPPEMADGPTPSSSDERHRGRTVLLSSHILSEVETLCDRVSIIRHGRTVESGTLAEMRRLTRTTVTAELTGVVPRLGDVPGVHAVEVDGRRVRCQVDGDGLTELMRELAAAGIQSLTSQPPTLEEMFLRHYGEQEVAVR